MTKVSIVIPTYNRLPKLKMVLAALEKQDFCPDLFEVVVVSDGSTDGTNEYLQSVQTSFPLKPVLQSNQGVAVARNQGTTNASGEIILFVDDDVVPAPCLISEHMQIHDQQGDKVVVLGPMLTPRDYKMTPWVEWEQLMLEKQYIAMLTGRYDASSRQFFTGNTSLGRRYLLEVGGFDPSFRRAEDVELAYRLSDLGMKFTFNPKAIGYHYAERSYRSWSSIPYLYGQNDVIFSLQKQHRWLLPTIFSEFQERHTFTRALTHLCLDHPVLSRWTVRVLKHSSLLLHESFAKKISMVALSGIFNLYYYQGVADQLGGRKFFFDGVNQSSFRNLEDVIRRSQNL